MRYSLIILLASIIGATACKQTPSLPLIERNEEVANYIHALDHLIDDFFDLVETMEATEMNADEKEETGFFDGLMALTEVGSDMVELMQTSKKVYDLSQEHEDFEKKLSATDYVEFLQLYTKTMKRFEDQIERLEAREE